MKVACLLAVLTVCTSAVAADQRPTKRPSDSVGIEGHWIWTNAESESDEKLRVVITAKTLVLPNKRGPITMAYTLDPTQSPKAINTTQLDIDESVTRFGIYELEGDTLKMCFSIGPKARPERFDGRYANLLVLKRARE